MKLLLDENLPDVLKESLKPHYVRTVDDEGWRSVKNGELLQLMLKKGFEVLITADTSLQYQQNFRKYPIPIVVLRAKKLNWKGIQDFIPQLQKLLKRRLRPGPHELFLHL